MFKIGEGLHDEAVTVTPLHRGGPSGNDYPGFGGGGSGETVNNFYGELVFPNIENGDDAEEFIKNLEALST